MPDTNDWQKDNTMLNSNALQKLFTEKPGTNESHSIIIMAFITSKNNPSVSIVAGSVKSISMGFTKILSNPKTTATSKAAFHPVTFTPGNRYESSSTKTVVKNILISVFILRSK